MAGSTSESHGSSHAAALLALCFIVACPGLVTARQSAAESVTPAIEACSHPPKALIVLRHACKATRCEASLLNDVGEQQARDLALDLADQGVDAIFVTTSERTQQTAAVLASEIGQSVDCRIADASRRCLDDSPAGIDGLLEEVCSGRYADQVVLHIGHFHTLPALFRKLGLRDPRSYLSAKPWKISFDGEEGPTYHELPLEYTTPLGSNDCGTTACGASSGDG